MARKRRRRQGRGDPRGFWEGTHDTDPTKGKGGTGADESKPGDFWGPGTSMSPVVTVPPTTAGATTDPYAFFPSTRPQTTEFDDPRRAAEIGWNLQYGAAKRAADDSMESLGSAADRAARRANETFGQNFARTNESLGTRGLWRSTQAQREFGDLNRTYANAVTDVTSPFYEQQGQTARNLTAYGLEGGERMRQFMNELGREDRQFREGQRQWEGEMGQRGSEFNRTYAAERAKLAELIRAGKVDEAMKLYDMLNRVEQDWTNLGRGSNKPRVGQPPIFADVFRQRTSAAKRTPARRPAPRAPARRPRVVRVGDPVVSDFLYGDATEEVGAAIEDWMTPPTTDAGAYSDLLGPMGTLPGAAELPAAPAELGMGIPGAEPADKVERNKVLEVVGRLIGLFDQKPAVDTAELGMVGDPKAVVPMYRAGTAKSADQELKERAEANRHAEALAQIDVARAGLKTGGSTAKNPEETKWTSFRDALASLMAPATETVETTDPATGQTTKQVVIKTDANGQMVYKSDPQELLNLARNFQYEYDTGTGFFYDPSDPARRIRVDAPLAAELRERQELNAGTYTVPHPGGGAAPGTRAPAGGVMTVPAHRPVSSVGTPAGRILGQLTPGQRERRPLPQAVFEDTFGRWLGI